jgi:hypothetical protein
MINETQQQLQIVFEGSTTITLPNSTELLEIQAKASLPLFQEVALYGDKFK